MDAGTLELVYSATKAATATCAHLLAQRGELDLDRPAAWYWPEFAAQGKADIPVRWLLSHRAGLPVIDNPMPLADLLAWDPMAAALAAQRPAWEPGTAHGYHGRTFGWLVGEVIRRVSGRSVGTFFAEEIAGPAGLDFFIGLPAAERGRVSRMIIDDPPGAEVANIPIEQIPKQFRGLVAAFTDPGSLMNRAFALSTPDIDFNSPEAQAAEIPSSNGICTADGLARLYAALIGEVDGVRILDAASLTARSPSRPPDSTRCCWYPPVSHRDTCSRRRSLRSAGRARSAIRDAAGRSASATRRAGSRSATWSVISGRTSTTTGRGCSSRPSGLPGVGPRQSGDMCLSSPGIHVADRPVRTSPE